MNAGRDSRFERPERRPVLSVIIPTRNRAQYAVSSIRNVLSIRSPNVELVVQDNGDTEELQEAIQGIDDNRLRYSHVRNRLDVIENFSRALESSTAEYICFIGDDDGVNSEIVEATVWAQEHALDALVPTIPALYWWPDLRFRNRANRSPGSLDIRKFGGRVSFPAVDEELQRCARRAGQALGSLPRIYYGVVRRDCLDKVAAQLGTCFPGPSPDFASAVALASFAPRVARIDYPLFLPGSSAVSTAGLGARKAHVGSLEDQDHLPKGVLDKWSELVPRFFSVQTIWAEDVVQALRATGRKDVLSGFNTPLLHAACAVFHPRYAPLVLRSFRRALRISGKNVALGSAAFAWAYASTWAVRARFLARNSFARPLGLGIRAFEEVENIEQAAIVLSRYLAEGGWQLGNVLKNAH